MNQNQYRIAALDMDGTLLNSDHVTTLRTRETIRRAAEAGKIVALSTGRCLSELTEHFDALRGVRYIICENGACIYDQAQKKCLHRTSIPADEAEYVLNLLRRYDVMFQMFIDDQSYLSFPRETELAPYKLEEFRPVFETSSIFQPDLADFYRRTGHPSDKINGFFRTLADREDAASHLKDRNLTLVISIGHGLELSPAGVDKAVGLRRLCDLLGLPMESAIAMGDSGNDLEILRAAGLGIAMGNASDELKSAADFVTADCDHDGAALALERFLLGRE